MPVASSGRPLVERVEVYAVEVPLAGAGFRNAYATKTVQRSAIVRLTASDGCVGLGNVDPSPGYSSETIEATLAALASRLAPASVGLDAANLHRLTVALDACTPGFLDAKAALEMAAVDMAARRLGIAVHEWLGGAVVERVRFNGWIGIVPPEVAAAEARAWQSRGFRSTKIKGGSGVKADADRVRAVREAVGPALALRVDANGAYPVDEAIALARALEPFGLQLLEQPVARDDLAGMAAVRRATSIPLMADESVTDHASLLDVIAAGCADFVKVKVMKQGGLLGCRRMMETAAAAGLGIVVGHGFGLGINTLADIMVAATSSAVLEGLECVGPLKTAGDVVRERLDLTRGELPLPLGPGLGAVLDEEALARRGERVACATARA